MADVYEKNLSQKTALGMTDYIRVVGSDNVSYKQLVSDVANKIITQYASASLAGSNQSVKSALDALNSNTYGLKIPSIDIPDGSDLDNYKTPGVYRANGTSVTQSLINCPHSTSGIKLIVENTINTGAVLQTIKAINIPWIYVRGYNESSWTPWQTLVNNPKVKTITVNSETIFTIPNNYRGTLKILDSSTGQCGMYFVVSTGAGAVAMEAIKAATNITITEGTNTLTIKPTSGTRWVIFETYSGTGEPS